MLKELTNTIWSLYPRFPPIITGSLFSCPSTYSLFTDLIDYSNPKAFHFI